MLELGFCKGLVSGDDTIFSKDAGAFVMSACDVLYGNIYDLLMKLVSILTWSSLYTMSQYRSKQQDMTDILHLKLPLHHDALREFHSLVLNPTADLIEETQNQFLKTLKQIVQEAPLEYPRELIESLESEYKQLKQLQKDLVDQETLLTLAKAEFKKESDECQNVTVETWDQYRMGNLTAPSLEEKFLSLENEQKLSKDAHFADADELTRIFLVLPHIWEDPTAVVPDNLSELQEEQDEIKISGGSIELTCPITFQSFTLPMISRKCGHVFDKPALEQFLQDQTKTCPQGACSQNLNIKDFVIDTTMQFRCLINETRGLQKRLNNEGTTNILD